MKKSISSQYSMLKQIAKNKIKNLIAGGVVTVLLVALGFLLWTIRGQHYEIISLRNDNDASRSDLEVMRRTISLLSLRHSKSVSEQDYEQITNQNDKMNSEEKRLLGDSFWSRDSTEAMYREKHNGFLHDLEEWCKELYYAASVGAYYVHSKESVIYSDDLILSYKIEDAFYLGGAHDSRYIYTGTVNRNPFMKRSPQLKLSDIVSKEDMPKMRARLIDSLRQEYIRRGDEVSANRELDFLKPTENFYYDENGLHFVFNEYDIDCYAAGDFDLCIEWPLPESVVSWKRGAGTHELPDDLYIPPPIAPLPFKEDFDFKEDDLPISVSGPLQDSPDAIVQFPPKKQDEEQSGRYGTIHSGQEGIHATKEMPAYYEQLNAFLRSKWSAIAPSSVELNGNISTWPVIELTIAKDGRVAKTVAVSKSGNNVLDAAVEALLLDLKDVPAPPQPAVIQVRFDIR